ncbi:hypothetical protein F-LCD7_0009 [Faustovirus]|nr:hypothetical protein F-LCD7_0009 [Faustovirus]QJX72770.1 hypothetical protein F-VV57_0008 [Faustovirus]QJX73275.1 hypothetical protein F-VV63_0009 [Faustovirus]
MESVEESILPVEIIRMIALCGENTILKISGLCKLFYYDLYKLRRLRCRYVYRDRDDAKHKLYYTSKWNPEHIIETAEWIDDKRLIICTYMASSNKRTYFIDRKGRECMRFTLTGGPVWDMVPHINVCDDNDKYDALANDHNYKQITKLPTTESKLSK